MCCCQLVSRVVWLAKENRGVAGHAQIHLKTLYQLSNRERCDAASLAGPDVDPRETMMQQSLEQLLQGSSVSMRDGGASEVMDAIRSMQKQGGEKLVVLADFDMTLTRYDVNGGRGCTSFSVIETSNLMPESYRKEVKAVRAIYAPMEVNQALSEEERRRCMKEWYSRAHELLIEYKVRKENLKEMVRLANIKLRDGCECMFKMLDSAAVPLVILSAGISDTLMLTIEEQSAMRDNMSVISNSFQFNELGTATGFIDTMITSSSKGSGDLRARFDPLSGKLKGRSNVILIGDSLGDPQMVNAMETLPTNVIKIGFLNHDVDRLLETYLQLYDIVLTGDGDMSLINQILQFILQT